MNNKTLKPTLIHKILAVSGLLVIFCLNLFAQAPNLVVQTGHPAGGILAVAVSADGKLALTGSNDQTALLWDLETGKQLRGFVGHKGEISCVQFSKDGLNVLTASSDTTLRLWKTTTGKEIRQFKGNEKKVLSCAISADGKFIAGGGEDRKARIWDLQTGDLLYQIDHAEKVYSVAFSPDSKHLLTSGENFNACLFSTKTGKPEMSFIGHRSIIRSVAYKPTGEQVLTGSWDGTVRLWNAKTGQQVKTFSEQSSSFDFGQMKNKNFNIESANYTPSGKGIIAILSLNGIPFDVINWNILSKRVKWKKRLIVNSVALTKDEKYLVAANTSVGQLLDATAFVYSIPEDKSLKSLTGESFRLNELSVSSDSTILTINNKNSFNLISGQVDVQQKQNKIFGEDENIVSRDGRLKAELSPFFSINDLESGKKNYPVGEDSGGAFFLDAAFSPDGKIIATASIVDSLAFKQGVHNADIINSVRFWDVKTGKEIYHFGSSMGFVSVAFSPDEKGRYLAVGASDGNVFLYDNTTKELKKFETFHTDSVKSVKFVVGSKGRLFVVSGSNDSTTRIWDITTGKEICALVTFHNGKWAIVESQTGRYDAPDGVIDGLRWTIDSEPLRPLPIEIFMHDYYEPNLLPRLMRCTEENDCKQEFKEVRNLNELNRTQPVVKITGIKATNAADIVEVTVEVKDAMSENQRDKQNKPLRSGAADLRLFRDGQLVGYAPDGDGDVALDKNGKFTKTFAVRLPKNQDLKEVSFTAHAFNSDRVKSETAQKTYVLPQKLPNALGSAFIVTIGVNANETASYNLRYAANDARSLQSELIKNLPKDRYEKIVQISLISDFDNAGNLTNDATKVKIKSVLDKLAGKEISIDILKDVPNAEFLKKVQPEDFVLIAFSGHGYASREGVFYLIPYDIGKNANDGLKSVLGNSISSDELSLWLRDVDAGELIMIVDACHSATAVQGAEFKPGPMGARGLGQLSYDKGMRILTATQADNVALELDNLQHGLLTYSLVKNGIELGLADNQPQDNKLFSNEWLGFAVKDVALLYEKAAQGGLKNLFVDGNPKRDIIDLDDQKSNLNLQQPSLFDFSRRVRQYELINLPLKNKPAKN